MGRKSIKNVWIKLDKKVAKSMSCLELLFIYFFFSLQITITNHYFGVKWGFKNGVPFLKKIWHLI